MICLFLTVCIFSTKFLILHFDKIKLRHYYQNKYTCIKKIKLS